MKMNVEFGSKEELLSFIGMFSTTPITAVVDSEKHGQAPAKVVKPASEKSKKDKVDTNKEEQSKVEEKKDETPKVEVEVTGVDETPTEPPKDAEVKEGSGDQVEVTKEMIRAICSQAIKAGKSAEVKNIVSKYGASKLPDLKEECYSDAYKDVEALL